MRLECLRQFRKVVNGFYNKWINREGPILGGQQLVDPQTRNHPWLVWMIRKSRVSRKIRLKIRFPEIETRFAAKPSVGRIEKNFSFFFFFCAPKIRRLKRNDSRIRHVRVFQIVNFVRPFYSRQISSIKRFRGDLFEFSRRENVLGMQNTFGSETLLKVVSREYFSQIDELVASQTRVAQK